MSITKTVIDDTLTRPDGLDVVDLTGNGLLDYLVAEEGGKVYWFEQTARGTFTRHTINGTAISGAKCEGAKWWNVGGEYRAVILDQNNGNIYLYETDVSEDYDGTWTRGTIQSSRYRLQDAQTWDVDGDGVDELVYSWEGTEPSTGGGIHWLDYDSSGSVTASGSYTDYTMTTQVGSWWMSAERRDLGGAQGAMDFVFTARDRGSNASQGVYILKAPSDVTSTWTKTQIESGNEDWLHCGFGNFFGTAPDDVWFHSYDGTLRVRDHSDDYSTSVDVVTNYRTAFHGASVTPFSRNGRNKLFAGGSSGVNQWKTSLFSWNGSAWEEEDTEANILGKPDDRIIFQDVDGDGYYEIVYLDSGSSFSDFSYLTVGENVGGAMQITGGAFNSVK